MEDNCPADETAIVRVVEIEDFRTKDERRDNHGVTREFLGDAFTDRLTVEIEADEPLAVVRLGGQGDMIPSPVVEFGLRRDDIVDIDAGGELIGCFLPVESEDEAACAVANDITFAAVTGLTHLEGGLDPRGQRESRDWRAAAVMASKGDGQRIFAGVTRVVEIAARETAVRPVVSAPGGVVGEAQSRATGVSDPVEVGKIKVTETSAAGVVKDEAAFAFFHAVISDCAGE